MWRGWVGIAGWTEDNEEVSSPEKAKSITSPFKKNTNPPSFMNKPKGRKSQWCKFVSSTKKVILCNLYPDIPGTFTNLSRPQERPNV